MKSTIQNANRKKVPGLFVGLCNLDIIYYSDQKMPKDNSKKIITDYHMAIGGPAANAAITYALLGGEAYLVCAVGESPMGQMVKTMLVKHGVNVLDLAEGQECSCNVSCIHVNTENGDRTILSGHTVKNVLAAGMSKLGGALERCSFALYDGNLPGVEEELIAQLSRPGRELVLDAGSFKGGFSVCFRSHPTVISSESFRAPDVGDVFALHQKYGFCHSAQTRGGRSIRYEKEGQIVELSVRHARAVDTLGAGDILHGAYCYFKYAQKLPFEEALSKASELASYTVEKRGVVAGIEYAKEMLV